eukprot:2905589-Pleurochrysis_carterae.AAC.1
MAASASFWGPCKSTQRLRACRCAVSSWSQQVAVCHKGSGRRQTVLHLVARPRDGAWDLGGCVSWRWRDVAWDTRAESCDRFVAEAALVRVRRMRRADCCGRSHLPTRRAGS